MLADPFLNYLDQSPTAFHAVANAAKMLEKAGFVPLNESQEWDLHPGGAYFTIRGGTSLCAFTLPEKQAKRAIILAAHTDSPGFKLKPHTEYRTHHLVMWGIEVYGEPLLTSWLNRDLGLAGRIFYGKEQIFEKQVTLDSCPVTLPQLAIHLDREANDKGTVLNRQDHLQVLAAIDLEGEGKGAYLEKLLEPHIAGQPLLATELFLYPLEKARYLGPNKQMIASYRLDNLSSCYASLQALLQAKHPQQDTVQMAVLWDHEEIGSMTAQGASSSFLNDVLARVHLICKIKDQSVYPFMAKSLCLSIDVAHAVHPSYLQKFEPHHHPFLGHGIALKFNAKQRYAFDGPACAALAQLCDSHHIPLQKYVCRGDIPCGSTVGPITAARTGIRTIDIGVPQFSMHAARELISSKDQQHLEQLLKLALESYLF